MESALSTSAFRQTYFFEWTSLEFYWLCKFNLFRFGHGKNKTISSCHEVKKLLPYFWFQTPKAQRPTLRGPGSEETSTWLEEGKQTYFFSKGMRYMRWTLQKKISACSCPILWARRTAAFFLNAFQPPKELLKAVDHRILTHSEFSYLCFLQCSFWIESIRIWCSFCLGK